MSTRAAKIYDFTIPAGGSSELLVEGSYYRILESTGALEVRRDGGSALGPIYPGQGERAQYKRLTLVDKSGAGNSGLMVVGDDTFIDDRISGLVEVIDGGKVRTKTELSFVAGFYANASAGQYGAMQLLNPAGSGRDLVVTQINYSRKSIWGVYLARYATPLANNLAANITNKVIGAGAPVAQFRRGWSGSILGSIFTYVHLADSTVSQLRFADPMIVPQGEGIVCVCDSVNIELAATFEWYEEVRA